MEHYSLSLEFSDKERIVKTNRVIPEGYNQIIQHMNTYTNIDAARLGAFEFFVKTEHISCVPQVHKCEGAKITFTPDSKIYEGKFFECLVIDGVLRYTQKDGSTKEKKMPEFKKWEDT